MKLTLSGTEAGERRDKQIKTIFKYVVQWVMSNNCVVF